MDWVRSNRLAVVLGVFGLLLGAGIGASGSDQKVKTTTVATTQTETETQTVNAPAAVLRVTRATLTTTRARLSDVRSQVSAERGILRRLEAQVSGTRASIKRGTFAGSGTYLVGQDIDPGTYRAAATDGCYWARLSTLNTSDIIDNDNANGPVVVEIAASDKAFTASGCAKFHKIA
jgi:hypothetical protein